MLCSSSISLSTEFTQKCHTAVLHVHLQDAPRRHFQEYVVPDEVFVCSPPGSREEILSNLDAGRVRVRPVENQDNNYTETQPYGHETSGFCYRWQQFRGVLLWTLDKRTVHVVTKEKKRCTRTRSSCTKRPRFGFAGSKMAESCSRYKKNGMVNLVTKRCTHT